MKKMILLSLFVLTGCATTTHRGVELDQAQIRERLQRSTVSVHPVVSPARLVERTKGQAVGNFVVASVLSSAAGSGAGARSANEMQANTKVTQSFGQQLNQALPTGQETKGGAQGVDVVLLKRLSERFPAVPASPGAAPLELGVSVRQWELGYESFLTSSDYLLSYLLEVRVTEPGDGGAKLLKSVQCQGEAPRKMPLDAWQADDYREVNKAADEIAEDCYRLSMKVFGVETP